MDGAADAAVDGGWRRDADLCVAEVDEVIARVADVCLAQHRSGETVRAVLRKPSASSPVHSAKPISYGRMQSVTGRRAAGSKSLQTLRFAPPNATTCGSTSVAGSALVPPTNVATNAVVGVS